MYHRPRHGVSTGRTYPPAVHEDRSRLTPLAGGGRCSLQPGCLCAPLPAPNRRGGEIVKRVLLALAALGVLASAGSASKGSASTAWSLVGTNVPASSPLA